MTRSLPILAALLLAPGLLSPRSASAQAPVQAIEGGRIASIQVRGNRRAESAAVLSVVQLREGGELDLNVASEDIRRIYSLRYFEDVAVDVVAGPEGLVVTFLVTEKPSVRKIVYIGNDEVSKEDLKDVVNVRPFSVLNVAEVKRNAVKIRDLYTEKGYFLAEVSHEIVPKGKHQVDVVFRIIEQAKVQVRRITFLGNQDIQDKELKEAIMTKEGDYFSFLSQKGSFKKEIFERDLMVINGYYYDRGYINVKVGRPRITLSADKTALFITVPIDEGEQFSIGSLDTRGDILGSKEEILKLISLGPGDVFNRTQLFTDLNRVGDFYKDKSFAYANVSPLTRTEPKKRLIHVTIDIQKGKPVHFGRIEIRGNLRTRDKVIRRELKIYEGEAYTSTGIARSRRNIMRLGFFEKAEINPRPGSSDDVMDIVIIVKERHTGTFQIGAGFSSYESFIATAQISQNNLFGRGQALSFQGTLSSIRQQLNLSFTEPRFLDSNWLFSFDAFRFELDYLDFVRRSSGGDVTLGYRITDHLSMSFTYENAYVDWTFHAAPNRNEAGRTSSVKGTLSWDTRDNRLFPSRGQFHSVSLELADEIFMSENLFTRLRVNTRFYHPLPWNLVFKNAVRYGAVFPHAGKPVPTFERFFVGGIYSVRGFRRNSLGPLTRLGPAHPQDPLLLVNTGGEEELVLNFEIEFPIFQEAGIRGVIFSDFGQAFCGSKECSAVDPELETSGTLFQDPWDAVTSLRASWGFGFRWFSPIGPLRFEWGFPFSPLEGEDPMVFEFTIGNFL